MHNECKYSTEIEQMIFVTTLHFPYSQEYSCESVEKPVI